MVVHACESARVIRVRISACLDNIDTVVGFIKEKKMKEGKKKKKKGYSGVVF